MISKWANYVITAVRYETTYRNGEGKRIAAVEARMDLGGRLGRAEIWTRQQIQEAISHDHETFATALPGKSGRWRRGDHVRQIRINGLDYLRTDRVAIPGDDLGELAELWDRGAAG
ncbi:MAG: hypothetical protein ABI835_15780 [Chloroflexota bacterium]